MNNTLYQFREVVDRGDCDCRFVILEDYKDGRVKVMEVNVCSDLPYKPVNVYKMSDLEVAND